MIIFKIRVRCDRCRKTEADTLGRLVPTVGSDTDRFIVDPVDGWIHESLTTVSMINESDIQDICPRCKGAMTC